MPHAGTFLSICFQPEDQSGRKTRNIILTSRPHSSIRGGYQPGVLRLALPVNAPVPVTSQAAGGTGGFLSMQQGAPLPGWSLRLGLPLSPLCRLPSPSVLLRAPICVRTRSPSPKVCLLWPRLPGSCLNPIRKDRSSFLRETSAPAVPGGRRQAG